MQTQPNMWVFVGLRGRHTSWLTWQCESWCRDSRTGLCIAVSSHPNSKLDTRRGVIPIWSEPSHHMASGSRTYNYHPHRVLWCWLWNTIYKNGEALGYSKYPSKVSTVGPLDLHFSCTISCGLHRGWPVRCCCNWARIEISNWSVFSVGVTIASKYNYIEVEISQYCKSVASFPGPPISLLKEEGYYYGY